jgi:geranylgeranyl pyrophosphate synthase
LQTLHVLDIFRKKTAPAFEVALRIGAAWAEAGPEIHEALTRYSEALGIAYQVRDDLDDLDLTRPALPLAIAFERAKDEKKALLNRIWSGAPMDDAIGAEVRELIHTLGADERCQRFLESYKEQAVRSLTELQDAGLKGLLRRVIGKIFSVEIKGWCGEFEARNAAGSEALTQATR